VGIGKDAPPGAADIDRDDRVVGPPDDPLEAATELSEHAVPRQLPLGEDADHIAVIQGSPSLLHELQEPLFAILGGDRDYPHEAEQAAQKRGVVDAPLHDETDAPLVGGGQEQGIQPGDMVRDQQCRPLGR